MQDDAYHTESRFYRSYHDYFSYDILEASGSWYNLYNYSEIYLAQARSPPPVTNTKRNNIRASRAPRKSHNLNKQTHRGYVLNYVASTPEVKCVVKLSSSSNALA